VIAETTFRIVLAFTLLTILAGSASAYNAHLNVTFSETVHQNVTYARYFDLVENRTYSLIEGVLTVYNPGTETVFDTHIKVINTENLASNFTQVSGRPGAQVIFPKNSDNYSNWSGVINTTYTAIAVDIDEDGNVDRWKVNATHLVVNISSEYQVIAYPLYNTSGAADLSQGNQVFSNLTLNITSIREDNNYNDDVRFAQLIINGTATTANQLNSSELTLTLNDTKRNYTVLHIPELRSGQSTVFNYNVSSLLVEPPLDINTTYTNSQYQSKVLAGEYFGIQDVATNVATVGALTIVNISIHALGVNVSNVTGPTYWELHNFTLHNLSATGDWTNVTNESNRTWYWHAGGGTIGVGETFNISYLVRAPDTVSSSGTYAAIQENLSYTIAATASRVGMESVRSRAEVNFTTTKQIITPQDNLSNYNVTWRSVPAVGTYQNISYTLEKVTLWVTSTIDPNQMVSGLNATYNIDEEVNLSSTWTGSQWLFNYTDGSSDTAPPPIIWIKPYWIIANTGGQILNSSITTNGTDTYLKYIYVVNGYWLEVEKNVTSSGDDRYEIFVHVHNRGNGHTPQNLTVTVYDFVPQAFTPFNFSPSFNNASNVSGQYTGTAYQWDVGLRTNLSTSFAPSGDLNDYDEFFMNYTVNGTGDYVVSELYIVGLDPRKVDNANAVEPVTVLSGIASTSKELVYLGIVVFLIAINIGNFLMTSRINKKLDKKE
jgi:hypothetical protein